ncbi:MAG TPA: cupin domain-containing protein [Kofleriaceae bacterium]|nr:cupin domain-containing protein [Kofleriaceae bacterium]
MTADLRELLPLYALGVLEPDEATAVERAVATDPVLAAELDTFRDAAHQLASAAPPVAPSAGVKARLMSSIGAGRFERFAARLAKLYDFSIDRAREALGLIDRAASWKPELPVPGILAIDIAAGPACAGCDTGFVKIDAGCTFPWHTHRGEEVNVLLQGTLRDHEGKLYRPGDEVVLAKGASHEIAAVGDEDVIIAARVFDGIDLTTRP